MDLLIPQPFYGFHMFSRSIEVIHDSPPFTLPCRKKNTIPLYPTKPPFLLNLLLDEVNSPQGTSCLGVKGISKPQNSPGACSWTTCSGGETGAVVERRWSRETAGRLKCCRSQRQRRKSKQKAYGQNNTSSN